MQKAKQSKKAHKTPNGLPAWELLLFVIYSHWVGRERGISGRPELRPSWCSAGVETTTPQSSSRHQTPLQVWGIDPELDVPTNPSTQRSSPTQLLLQRTHRPPQTLTEGSVLPVTMMGILWATHRLHKRGKAAGSTARCGPLEGSSGKTTARSVHIHPCKQQWELCLTQ